MIMSTGIPTALSRQPFAVARATVKPQLNEIHQGGHVYRVERQVMLLMIHLAERVDSVVTRQELFSALWGDSPSGDEALTQTISKLRKALGKDASGVSPIQTIRKVGYRLGGPVHFVTKEDRARTAAPRKASRWKYAAIAAVLFAAVVRA